MSIDIAGFIHNVKEHAIKHGFHIHDERHFVETYSLRQSWEVDLHPAESCNLPIDLHLSLDVEPRALLALIDRLEEMEEDFEEPEDIYQLHMYFNWSVPPLTNPPDLLVLATDLAGIGDMELPIEVQAIDSYAPLGSDTQRRLMITGTVHISLVDLVMGREQLCDTLDLAKEVSLYLADRVEAWA